MAELLIHSNNYRTATTASINTIVTTLPVASVVKLPSLAGDNYCYLTILEGSQMEIVKATANTGLNITIERAQQDTVAASFSSGAIVSLRPTTFSFDTKVAGPASATDGAFVLFDGTSGKVVKDGPGSSGTGNVVRVTSPTLITPTLGVATATSINFGEDTLNKYDEGTFTPVFTCATPGDLAVTHTTQTGVYTRLGNRYDFELLLGFSLTYTTASGALRIGGLPFTTNTSITLLPIPALNNTTNFVYSPAGGTLYAFPVNGQSYLQLEVVTSGATPSTQSIATSMTSGQTYAFRVKGTIFV
jgi:hypothetical protein